MKKLVLLSIGMLAFALQPAANAQTELFTTYNDWSLWSGASGATVAPDNTFSTDASTINGLGNTTAAGASDTSGSMLVTWSSGSWENIANASTEQANNAFIAALDPGFNPSVGTAPASGVITIDYSVPQTASGTYFQLGILLQYPGDGYWGTFFTSSTTDLGFMNNYGQEVYRGTIDYTISPGPNNGFGFGLMYNSDYAPVLPFTVDNITLVSAVPEPGTMALVGLGLAGLTFIRRCRQG